MNHPAKAKWMAPPAALAARRYRFALVSVAAALGLAQTFLHFHLPQAFTVFGLSAIAITFSSLLSTAMPRRSLGGNGNDKH
jgi:hypothetical protein